MKRSDWDGDEYVVFTQSDEEEQQQLRSPPRKKKERPRHPLAVSMGLIPPTYDPSMLAWFLSVMPMTSKMSKRTKENKKQEVAVMEELGRDGARPPDLAMPPEHVRSTLKNMLIFFSNSDENRNEISILSRYCNMNVYVDTSTRDNAGLGLFVSYQKSVLGPGQRLTEYGGLRLAPDQPYNFDSVYVVDVYDFEGSNGDEPLFRIDGAHSFTLEQAGRWANRSKDDANAQLLYDRKTDALWLVSTKAIDEGHEIFWWYGDNFSQSVTQPSEEEKERSFSLSPSIREQLSGFYI
jgi:hypothetical protein